MKLEVMMEAVRAQMPEKRWKHTLGVMESAVELAEKFGGDREKANLAALLHDYAKFWPTERQKQELLDASEPEEFLLYDKALWHAPAGAYAVQRELGVEDKEILDAVRYHTSGRENMTGLDKIVCLADYIEPGRDYDGVQPIREKAKTDLEEALVTGFDFTIRHLISRGSKIFPLTVRARNGLLEEIQNRNKPSREENE